MRAPQVVWVHGHRYDKGDTIAKDDVRTAKVLLQIAVMINDNKKEGQS